MLGSINFKKTNKKQIVLQHTVLAMHKEQFSELSFNNHIDNEMRICLIQQVIDQIIHLLESNQISMS